MSIDASPVSHISNSSQRRAARSQSRIIATAVMAAISLGLTLGLEMREGLASMESTPWILVPKGSYTPLYGTKNKEPADVDAFELQVTPVTQAQFLEFVRLNPQWRRSKVKKLFSDKTYLSRWASDLALGPQAPPQSPVTQVSWFAANAYCRAQGARLPTVLEWEYAASQPIDGHEIRKVILDWYSIPTPKVLPSVTQGLRNRLGIACMHGLIWEWTLDFSSTLITGESRGSNSLDKDLFCGSGSAGSADNADYAAFIRFGMRNSLKANYTVANLGFRCARDLTQGLASPRPIQSPLK
jgi:sulfatase modifying factor 1